MLEAAYTTASAAAVARFVVEQYELADADCRLLHRGINDVYAVSAPGGADFVLRLSSPNRRSEDDTAAETAFLAYLHDGEVPVAAAMRGRAGNLFTMAEMPEGRRIAVLFQRAMGRVPQLDAPEDARAQGVTLARVHQAGEVFAGREAGQYRVDLDHLLRRPTAAILTLDLAVPVLSAELRRIAASLAASVEALPGLSMTRCHGDCHGLNARIATDGGKLARPCSSISTMADSAISPTTLRSILGADIVWAPSTCHVARLH